MSKRRPCPICGRDHWCGVSADGEVAICMHVQSERPTRNGGWRHQLNDTATGYKPVPPPVEYTPRPATRRQIDCPAIMRQYAAQTQPGDLRRLALQLGVSTDSLTRLDAVWAAQHQAWAFPMRDPAGEIVGIRLRAEDGGKWAVTGSRNAIFIPDGQIGDLCNLVLAVEGPTDTAALLDLGFYAIGRPACRGQEQILTELLTGRNVVIVADRDEPKHRPDGTTWLPGQEGAQQLAEHLFGKARTVKVIKPLKGKDSREWIRAGATRQAVQAVIDNAGYWRPKRGR